MPRRHAALALVEPIRRSNLRLNAEMFSDDLEARNMSPQTIAAYRKATDEFEAFLEANDYPLDVAAIEKTHIRAFIRHLRERKTRYGRPTAEATVSQRYRSLQQFFKYLKKDGAITEDPFTDLEPPKVHQQMIPVITPEQMKQLLRTCDGTTFEDRRDTAVLSLFYDSGIRRAEMAGLRVTDIDRELMTATVTGKTGTRRARYGRDTRAILNRYLREREKHRDADRPELWLGQRGALGISGIEQIVQRRSTEAGLDLHPHSFRHAATHELLASGYSEGDAMYQMGWRSRQMVDRYAASARAERARDAFDTHSPMDKLKQRR